MGKLIDITGQKFYRLTAIRFVDIKYKEHRWLFNCECGNEVITSKFHPKKGNTKSCGCFHKEFVAGDFRKYTTTHHMTETRFYGIWSKMKYRCLNKNYKRFHDWGGRGIKVCDEWLKFENFRDDMYQSYLLHAKDFGENDTSIDRIDNDGNYCKQNCKWSTTKEQSMNKRKYKLSIK